MHPAFEDIKKALESNDLSRIKAAKEALDHEMQHIGEAMAKSQQASAGAGPKDTDHAQSQQGFGNQGFSQQQQQQSGKQPDDIEEAEVEIIDDKK